MRAAPRPGRLMRLLAHFFLILLFLPYVAFGVGENTNIAVSSVVGAVIIAIRGRGAKIWAPLLLTLGAPVVASFVRILAGGEQRVNVPAYATWFSAVIPLFASAVVFGILGFTVVKTISIMAGISAGLALVHKFLFLDRGEVPLLWLYDVPGYASVRAHAETLVNFNTRPFGLFPEPSFMAGSLALSAMILIALTRAAGRSLVFLDWLSISLVFWVIAISGSGSATLTLVLLAIQLAWFYVRKNVLFAIIAPVGIAFAVLGSLSIAGIRSTGFNWSWFDRAASILGALDLWVSDLRIFLLGIGRGMMSVYFQEGRVPLSDYTFFNYLPDVYSTLMRSVVESGLLFGLPVVAFMAYCLAARSPIPLLDRTLLLVAWIVVAGLTISYDSAAWLWAAPGLALGCRVFNYKTESEVTDGRAIAHLARSQ